MACPVNDRNHILLHLNNGYLEDKRINALINIESLVDKTFNVNETERQEPKPRNRSYQSMDSNNNVVNNEIKILLILMTRSFISLQYF
jgi:hypothetical protein